MNNGEILTGNTKMHQHTCTHPHAHTCTSHSACFFEWFTLQHGSGHNYEWQSNCIRRVNYSTQLSWHTAEGLTFEWMGKDGERKEKGGGGHWTMLSISENRHFLFAFFRPHSYENSIVANTCFYMCATYRMAKYIFWWKKRPLCYLTGEKCTYYTMLAISFVRRAQFS